MEHDEFERTDHPGLKKLPLAVRLIYAMLLLSVPGTFLTYYFSTDYREAIRTRPVSVLAMTVLSMLFWLFLARKISNRRNWARITYLVIFILSLFGGAAIVLMTHPNAAQIMFMVVQYSLQLYVAYILMFEPDVKSLFISDSVAK